MSTIPPNHPVAYPDLTMAFPTEDGPVAVRPPMPYWLSQARVRFLWRALGYEDLGPLLSEARWLDQVASWLDQREAV